MAVGQVIRSHSNIYYVLIEGREFECRSRGRFRLEKQVVLAGDLVEVLIDGEEGRIDKVLPRRTVLERPAIANVDQAVILFTLREPEADYPFLDRVLIHVERAGVAPIILLNKIDLLEPAMVADFCHIYGEQVGYSVYPIGALDGLGLDVVRPLLAGKLSVLAGHSGVGKSRLVRSLEPSRQDVRVGELSEKLGRGKHTTRHVELIPIASGGLLADTPGFTYLEFHDLEKRDLAEYFPEFRRYATQCRFDDCIHNKEPDCAVRAAVAAGAIAERRYANYTGFLKEVEALKRW
ncbi:MAG: putative GTPase [Firmicutes bacterium]|nr:putative GTPase [Bacillota bacterium]